MIETKNYRIIDVSAELHPGVLKVSGEYVHGKESRRFEIRQYVFAPDKTFMHWVETESHIGTHVEMPAHYVAGAKSSSEMPLETFLGEAIVIKLDFLKPKNGIGQPITPSDLSRVKEEDIVLIWSPFKANEAPYISSEAAKWLADKNIKMLGIQNVRLEESHTLMATHENLLKKDIPIVEGLVNLEKIEKERVFYIGLPLKVASLDSSWIRAVVLEPGS